MSLRRGVSWKARLRLKVFCVFIVSAFCVLGFMQKESLAVPFVSGPGDNLLGSFTGDISYDGTSLVVELTNTTAAGGGFLAAFAFNNPGFTGASLGSTSATFDTLFGGPAFNNGIAANPFGDFDIGAGAISSFLGGGSPGGGIAVGDSEIFTFTLVGGGGLGLQDFLDELSFNSTKPAAFFIARFKGIDETVGNLAGSDKVPGIPPLIPPQVPGDPIPEPTTVLLLGIGLVGLAGAEARRRRKKKAVDKS